MKNFTKKAELSGKTVKLELTEKEVMSAVSVCTNSGLKKVIVMKKHNGNACFFTDQRHANSSQDRHGFELAFTLDKGELEKFLEDNKSHMKEYGKTKVQKPLGTRMDVLNQYKEFWGVEKYTYEKVNLMGDADFNALVALLKEESEKDK